MSFYRIFRDSRANGSGKFAALAAGFGLAFLAGLAMLGRVAETPAAASRPSLTLLGPGALGKLRALSLDSAGQPPKGMAAAGRAALPGSPLAFEPFYAVAAEGFRGKRAHGTKRDAALLNEALRRNPRSREARLLLLRHTIGEEDLAGGIHQLAVINRLNGGAVQQLMMGLGAAIRNEAQVDEAMTALKPHPEMLEAFLSGFAAAQKSPELIVRMVRQIPKAALAHPKIRRIAVNQMVTAQAFSEAKAIWGAHARHAKSAKAGAGLVASPDFADTLAEPPFGWELAENTTGVGERQSGGGIMADYYGRRPGPIATQLLTLPPGRYTARIEYHTESGLPGGLGVDVTCAGTTQRLLQQPLLAKAGVASEVNMPFTVPASGCPGQFLAVIGRIRESREPQEAIIRTLDVFHGGGR